MCRKIINIDKNSTLLIVVLMAAGVLILLYPVLSNLYNKATGSYAIQEFNRQIDDQSERVLKEHRQMAEAYNNSLLGGQGEDACGYAYEEILDFGNGMMGYIEIPVIEVYLPLYHSVDESVLSKGVGHIPKTAFPIGGEGNHSVLSGHTGLPSAELFTDLAEVAEGDKFYIHILGEVVAYEVDQISVVLPEEAESLLPVAGKDYCTLVTCTPYGVNSHRLLVRGERIPYIESAESAGTVQGEHVNVIAAIGGAVGLVFVLLLIGAVILKWRGMLLAVALMCSLSAVPKVYAAEGVRTEETCMIQVDLRKCGFKELAGEQALPVEVELYKVANIDVTGNYATLSVFQGLDFSVVDEETTPKEWRKLATDAAELIALSEVSASAAGKLSDGQVIIDNLETGLYLVQVQQVASDDYVYTFTPFLVSLPNNYYYRTGEDNWVYELIGEYAICLKVDREERSKPDGPGIPEEEITEITEVVETGDESSIIMYTMLFAVSGQVLLRLIRKNKKSIIKTRHIP